MSDQPTPTSQPRHPAGGSTDPTHRPTVLDLPLILEQLQDQIDHLLDTVEAQQRVIEQHTVRLAALEQSQP